MQHFITESIFNKSIYSIQPKEIYEEKSIYNLVKTIGKFLSTYSFKDSLLHVLESSGVSFKSFKKQKLYFHCSVL